MLEKLLEVTTTAVQSHGKLISQHEKNFEVTEGNLERLAQLVNQQNRFLEALRLCVLQIWDHVGLPDGPTLPPVVN